MKKLEEKHKSINKTVDKFYNSLVGSDFVFDKLIDFEDRCRRNNLRIYDIPESWEKR